MGGGGGMMVEVGDIGRDWEGGDGDLYFIRSIVWE